MSIPVFLNFLVLIAALALVLALVDLARFVARRVGIDALEVLSRYQHISLDIEQRRINHEGAKLTQEKGRLAIQTQRKLLRGTPTAWDIEIEKE
jgi:hypothetical protein